MVKHRAQARARIAARTLSGISAFPLVIFCLGWDLRRVYADCETSGVAAMDRTGRDHSLKGGCQCCGISSPACSEAAVSSGLDSALICGLFPETVLRRSLLKSVRAATLLSALGTLLPLNTLKAPAQQTNPLEQTKLNVGFLPITCAAPLIYAYHLPTYPREA